MRWRSHDWLEADPSVLVHHLASRSWSILVTVWFGIIDARPYQRGPCLLTEAVWLLWLWVRRMRCPGQLRGWLWWGPPGQG